MSDATPSLIAGRYRLDERIGSGPMGEVWRGYDTRADWTVAVKMLGAKAVGAATRQVLRQHAQAVARVIHPNVAMVLDVGDHEGAPFLVMEFLTGPSLGEELAARGPMKVVEVCDLVGQAAAGLDAAHRAGVVHGQVKPDSLRLAGSGVLKVVGFGLAEQEATDADRRYRAPEQLDGRGGEAADLYALGVICYELLTGQAPAGQAPSSLRPEVPEELDRLVLALLAEDPAERPASGESLRRTLAGIARPRAKVVASPAPEFQPPVPRAGDTAVFDAAELAPPVKDSSNGRLFIQFGVAVGAIVAVTVAMVVMAGMGDEEPVAAPTPTVTLAPTGTSTPDRTPSTDPTPKATIALPSSEPTGLRETDVPNPKGTVGVGEPPGGWKTWAERFDEAVQSQMTLGGIDPRTASKAQEKIRKAGRKIAEGNVAAGQGQLEDVMRDLLRAREKGEMTGAGPLSSWLDEWRLR
ncbi:serine/threonine-protein kinase [Nonomuraea sp. LPB2021202275-12-8]|uniref:serine/threonine-protein kinase n=1 Tax=Nonomuraea sp. LPB2021202275-12-8 TaxID=3120159 RepID=UPI00300DA063